MPMSFPDLQSLEEAAVVWKFRARREGETEAEYRQALADHVQPKDFIESQEIRTGKGWDVWGDAENLDMLYRRGWPKDRWTL
jgi:hypothetical protein